MKESWIILSPDGRAYGPFDTMDDAYSWCYKQWPNPKKDFDRKVRLRQLYTPTQF